MAVYMMMPIGRRAGLVGAALFVLTGCGKDESKEIRVLKSQVQDAFGAKNYAKAYDLSVKGLALTRQKLGDKSADTLYFAVGVGENAVRLRNYSAAIKAMKLELDLRVATGKKEDKTQTLRRTKLIQLGEEHGDRAAAIEQTIIIAKSMHMGPPQDPQATYKPELMYPPELYRQHLEGDVDIGFGLDANGTPTGVHVLHATPPDVFNAAAIENLQRFRFTPYIENDQPVPSTGHHFTLAFRMQASKQPDR